MPAYTVDDYLDDAFAIAQLISGEIIKPSLETRLMVKEDREHLAPARV